MKCHNNKDTQEVSQSINHYGNALSETQTKTLRKSCNQSFLCYVITTQVYGMPQPKIKTGQIGSTHMYSVPTHNDFMKSQNQSKIS